MAKSMINKFAKVTLVLACAFLMSSALTGCSGKKCGPCPSASASKCGKGCAKPCCGKKGCAKGCAKPCCKKG